VEADRRLATRKCWHGPVISQWRARPGWSGWRPGAPVAGPGRGGGGRGGGVGGIGGGPPSGELGAVYRGRGRQSQTSGSGHKITVEVH